LNDVETVLGEESKRSTVRRLRILLPYEPSLLPFRVLSNYDYFPHADLSLLIRSNFLETRFALV